MNTFFRGLWLLLFSMSAASAAVQGWPLKPENSHAQVHVYKSVQTDGKIRLLLEVIPDEGWKTYWRTPGDGGFRPEIEWSSQVKSHWYWPRPVRFNSAGFSSVGYDQRVVFPLELITGEKLRLSGELTVSLCSNLCTVNKYPINVDLTAGPDAHFDEAWVDAMAAVPTNSGNISISSVKATGDTLRIEMTSPKGWSQADIFPDIPPGANLSQPRIDFADDKLTARFSVSDDQGKPLDASNLHQLSMVVTNGADSQQLTVDIAKPSLSWRIVAIALAGGLILNLMPCVLPVLGIKLASLMTLAENSRRQTQLRFLATSAGIIFSFLVLAAFITGLRQSGVWIGWGFQFQSPWFIALMVVVTWIFCFSLAGLIEFRLPSGLSTRLATAGGNGISGSFLEGTFATLLATPCTAPFLGTAITFALAAPVHQLWIVFLFLGIGMSLPWLIVSAVPDVARWIPKPGQWMSKLRLVLVLLMLGSCIWLMSLLVKDWGARYVLIVGALMVVFFLYRCAKAIPKHRENLHNLIFGVLFGAGLYAFLAPAHQGDTNSPLNWKPFSQKALSEAMSSHKNVLVDITADWCLNCRVNEVLVLHRPDVITALNQQDVVLLQGNWSKPSAEIEQFLRSHGASGIPFNAIFGPSIPEGHVLPPLLRKDELLTVLKEANTADTLNSNKEIK